MEPAADPTHLDPGPTRPRTPPAPDPMEGHNGGSKAVKPRAAPIPRRVYARRDPGELFMEKLEGDLDTGCWNWTGYTERGYGKWTNAAVGGTVRCHRFAFEYVGGTPIPEGRELDHICTNTRCCRPGHLQVATGQENRGL